MFRNRLLGWIAVPLAALAASTAGAGTANSQAVEPIPGSRPAAAPVARAAAAVTGGGMSLIFNDRGRVTLSMNALGTLASTGSLALRKPIGGTVRRAVLFAATTGFRSARITAPIVVNGNPVTMSHEVASGISSFNYWSDVTPLLKPSLDAAPAGLVSVTIAEPSSSDIDGTVLLIVFDDPGQAVDRSVGIVYGALQPGGDRFGLTLDRPFDPSDPQSQLEMSLASSFSCQGGACGSGQYSQVSVNGQRVSTAAGGQDDGVLANGAIITVGGVGDSTSNPSNPFALPTSARSDDELYDLRTALQAGDRSLTVETLNPSADDNVFVAAFVGNPPISSITTGNDKFVYVAFGDSYQSGEGAGFNIRPTADYLARAYENGSNYPGQVGAQQNTYTNGINGGDSCHRALLNYAKLNRNLLEPGAEVVLVDRTCSGATIEPSGKPAIVGRTNQPFDTGSQVQQAIDRLASVGLSPGDVDLVTVGMGGNDAKFGDIVAACVIPSLAKRLIEKYPNPPGEIEFLVNNVLNCGRLDGYLFKTDEAIAALPPKEVWAQGQLLGAFPGARVLQLDYPNPLPAKDAPDWCGGIGKDDVSFARKKVKKINDALRGVIASTGASNPKLELVEIESALGANPLCPSKSTDVRINGLNKANFDAEVERLLNLNGNGDAVTRGKVDSLVTAYRAARACYGNQLNPFDGSSCNTTQANALVETRAKDLLTSMQTQQNLIFANIVSRPGTANAEGAAEGFDRSRGLFHPNAKGFEDIACRVRTTYLRSTAASCPAPVVAPPKTANGSPWPTLPIPHSPGDLIDIVIPGFCPLCLITVSFWSSPIPLGTVLADADGVLRTSLTVPVVSAGLHSAVFEGESADGVGRTERLLVEVTGRPVGSYATYLCCFEPESDTIAYRASEELVDVYWNDELLDTLRPDENGGVIVQLPFIDRLINPKIDTLRAVSQLTGRTIVRSFNSIPTTAALWASSSRPDAIDLRGSGVVTNGLVHSEGGIAIVGGGATLTGGTEYASSLTTSGAASSFAPAARRVVAGQGTPSAAEVSAFRPGGTRAGSPGYVAIPASACTGGVWSPAPGAQYFGVLYVPCGVMITRANTVVAAIIAAEGPVQISGSNITIGSSAQGTPSVVTGAAGSDAVVITGAKANIVGTVFAPVGDVRISGAQSTFECGVFAQAIRVTGGSPSFLMTNRCMRAA